MKRLLAALLLLTVALPAWGATYWVRDAQSGAHTGADSSNAISLATFNSTAVAGDVALLVGTFSSTAPNPTNSGTIAAPIVYRGWSPGNRASATFAGTFYFATTTPDSNVLYRDFKVTTSGTSVGFYRADATWWTRYTFKNIDFTAAIIRFEGPMADCRWDSCTFNAQSFTFGGQNYHTLHNYRMAERDTIIDCVANIAHDGSNAEANSGASFNISTLAYNYWKRFRVNDVISGSGTHGTFKMYYAQRSLFEDCYFDLSSTRALTGPACDECNTSYFRDSTIFVNFNRDTFYIHGAYPMTNAWAASGSINNSMRGNHWDSCLVVNDAPTNAFSGTGAAIEWYDSRTTADSVTRCVFVNGSTTSIPLRANQWDGASVFDHNTVVQMSSPGQPRWSSMTSAGAKITNNIFYTYRDTSLTLDATSASNYDGDYNLFYSQTSATPVINSGGSTYSPGSGGTQCATYGEECTSVRGNPLLVGGASALAFDASLTAGSAALFGPDGYVGARSFSAGSTYNITVTQGSNGSITPSGVVGVASGASQTFTITPNAHYHVASVTVDGSGVGAVTSYTFTNVTANHTITAAFAIDTNDITSSAGANGSISPSGTTAVNYGASQTYTITPDESYHTQSVTVDGVVVGAPSSYTFTNVTTTHTIAAAFSLDQYTLYAQAYPNGTISPSGTKTVYSGAIQDYAITPDAGYVITDVLVDGASVGAVSNYTFPAITASHTIEAYFGVSAGNVITVTQTAGGTIAPAGPVTVALHADQTFTITPDFGYHVTSITVDGTPVAVADHYTFTDVTTTHTISATFAANTVSIITIVGANANGSIWPLGQLDGTKDNYLTIVPKPLCRVTDLYVNGTNVGPRSSYVVPRGQSGELVIQPTFSAPVYRGSTRRGRR